MVERRVPGDLTKGHRVVQDQVGEEATVLVASRRIVRKVEPVSLEIFPEQFGRQRMVLGPVLGATDRAFEGSSDRIGGFLVEELHGGLKEAGSI